MGAGRPAASSPVTVCAMGAAGGGVPVGWMKGERLGEK